ncbi:MAG: flagellar basal body P-ring protein FlgI [Phycisphaerae bacterium]|jgi:flagellar P-ring protein precursor FlgI
MRRATHVIMAVFAVLAQVLLAQVAQATSVKDLTRIEGQGESVLRGVGLVIGLSGSGDSTKDLQIARPLVALLQNNGQGVGLPDEFTKSKNEGRAIALVSVTCVVPRGGALIDDKLDVNVSVMNTATSLKGGRLYLTALQGPYKGQPVFAMAEGAIEIEDETTLTTARVRGGARMIRDVPAPEIGDEFKLVIEPPFAGWNSAAMMAESIQSTVAPLGRATVSMPKLARVIDERTIRIVIPPDERSDKAAFLADVLGTEIRTELLDLPAQVIINERTGAIIVTGDVQISPVAITHKDLTITTTVPAPVPSAANPQIRTARWADVTTGASPRESARLADLLAAFKNLDIPVGEQIHIIQMLHKTGKLHAKLVMD